MATHSLFCVCCRWIRPV